MIGRRAFLASIVGAMLARPPAPRSGFATFGAGVPVLLHRDEAVLPLMQLDVVVGRAVEYGKLVPLALTPMLEELRAFDELTTALRVDSRTNRRPLRSRDFRGAFSRRRRS